MGYYVPNKVKPVCYNCPYRTNKYCGLLTEHDYLGDYPFNFEPYPYCPLIEVADRKTKRLCDNCEFYKSGEICGHPSIGEVEMGGKGDTFPWIKETPKWCPLTDEPQTDCSWK